mmetsp:Transcript_49903/g.160372  ORF Transcript_49903/g.160372 Transcript_49903/m.160372 type:complete len:382 (-) Transcript_49903:1629-2774(-)
MLSRLMRSVASSEPQETSLSHAHVDLHARPTSIELKRCHRLTWAANPPSEPWWSNIRQSQADKRMVAMRFAFGKAAASSAESSIFAATPDGRRQTLPNLCSNGTETKPSATSFAMAQSQSRAKSPSTKSSARLAPVATAPMSGKCAGSSDAIRKVNVASTSNCTSAASRCGSSCQASRALSTSETDGTGGLEGESAEAPRPRPAVSMLCAMSQPNSHFSSIDTQEGRLSNRDVTSGLSQGSNFKHSSLIALLFSKNGEPRGIGKAPTDFVKSIWRTASSKSLPRLPPKGRCPVVTRWTSQPKENTSELVVVRVSGACQARVPPNVFALLPFKSPCTRAGRWECKYLKAHKMSNTSPKRASGVGEGDECATKWSSVGPLTNS